MPLIASKLDDVDEGTRQALQDLAWFAVDESDTSSEERLDPERLSPARAAGLLHEDDDVFTDGDTHAQALAESVVEDAADVLDDPAAFVALLHRLWRYGYRGHVRGAYAQAGPGARLIATLHAEGYDVLAALPGLYGAPGPGGEVPAQVSRAVQVAIETPLGLLAPTAQQALAIGRAAAAASYTRSAGSNVAGLAAVAQADAAVADEMLAALDLDDASDRSLVPHVIAGIARRDLADGLQRALALAANPTTADIGALALGGLIPEPGSAETDQVLGALDTLASSHPDDVAEALQHGPGRADPTRAALILARIAGATRGGDAAAFALLMQRSTSVPAIQAVAASPSITLTGLDHLRGLLLGLENAPDAVLDVAESYVLARPYGSEGIPDIDEAFPNALVRVDDASWSRRLPAWLCHRDGRLQRAAADAVNHFAQLKRLWWLDGPTLAIMSEDDLLFAARQILGRTLNAHGLVRLTLSFFDHPTLPPAVAEFVEQQLADFVAYTRPGETQEVLESIDPTHSPAYAGAQRVLAVLKQQWAERRAALPRIELQPPRIRTRAYEAADARLREMQMAAAREANPSITDQILTPIQLRVGGGFGVRMADGSLSVSPMGEMRSEGVTLWGDLVDPLGMRLRREQFIRQPHGDNTSPFDL